MSIDARVGWRPMPTHCMPTVRFTADAPGLYLTVMHPVVVMAFVVGRLETSGYIRESAPTAGHIQGYSGGSFPLTTGHIAQPG